MRRMFSWMLEKKLEHDRRREIRAMLKSFHIVMEQYFLFLQKETG